MTKEDKDLLLKDLCARLPYGVKGEKYTIRIDEEFVPLIDVEIIIAEDIITLNGCPGYTIKPHLFPLSSMTEEQFEELKAFVDLTYEGNTLELVEWDSTCDKTLEFWLEEIPSYCVIKVFDWLNKNHFDYRGLIPMGLANDATGLNIY